MKILKRPNIQLKNPLKTKSKKKIILLFAGAVVVIGAVSVFISLNSRKKQMEKSMEAAFTVETAQIERQTLASSISATGTVASAETKTVNTSLKDLEVKAVYVKEGDYVEEGTVICEFDSADYEEALAEAQHNAAINAQIEALESDYTDDYNESLDNAFDPLENAATSRSDAEDALDEAEDDLDEAESDYSKAKANYNTAKADYDAIADELAAYSTNSELLGEEKNAYNEAVNELAEAEQALAELKADENATEEQIAKAENTVENKKTAAAAAKEAYDKAATRYNELLTIKSAYENAQSKYNSAKSAVDSAEKTVEQAENTLEQAEEKLDSAWETYDEAVEKADKQYAKAALQDQLISETQDEKNIEQYTEFIEDCVVRATMSGVITSLKVTEGNVFEGGDVYTIQDNEHFIVTSSVDEYDIASIEKGMPAYIKTDATGDVEMTGEVTYVAIAPASTGGSMGAVSNSASYTIKVAIDEADENLRAGMTAKLSISLEESPDTLTVPYDAVTTAPDGSSTITVDMDGEKKTVSVEIGLETDYYTEIISDEISEGMTVYLTTPMISAMPSGSDDEENPFGAMFNGGGPGGDMPSGFGGGGMPSGGGPGGMPGGF